jgi:hypothetical protein
VADHVVVALANNLAVLHHNSAEAPACEQKQARSKKDEREVSPTDVWRPLYASRTCCRPVARKFTANRM